MSILFANGIGGAMSLRDKWRKLRLYYKSWPLFRQTLASPARALLFPLAGNGRFRTTAGTEFSIPRSCWFVLPNFCRLAAIGARPAIEGGAKKVQIAGVVLESPLQTKEEGTFYREIFVDDVYRIHDADLSGKVVVDIGAYVGDSAAAFALKGAEVYALEPSRRLFAFLQRNIAANGFSGRIHAFPVGLSDRAETVLLHANGLADESLELVDGLDFVLSRLPAGIEYLKLDCEGCEYHLLRDERFLAHLRPRRIAMEFHRGPQELPAILERVGYRVEVMADGEQVGYIYAELS